MATTVEQEKTARYAKRRTHLNWLRTPQLAIVKALAGEIQGRGLGPLVYRVERACEPVIRAVTGEAGWTLARVSEHALAEQGIEITDDMIRGRAWNSANNDEFTDYDEEVSRAVDAWLAGGAK